MIRLKHNRPRPCFAFKISNYEHGKVIPYVTRVTQDHFHSIFHFAPQHCKFFIVSCCCCFCLLSREGSDQYSRGTQYYWSTHKDTVWTIRDPIVTQGLSLRPTVGIISSSLASPSYINPFFEDKVVR